MCARIDQGSVIVSLPPLIMTCPSSSSVVCTGPLPPCDPPFKVQVARLLGSTVSVMSMNRKPRGPTSTVKGRLKLAAAGAGVDASRKSLGTEDRRFDFEAL